MLFLLLSQLLLICYFSIHFFHAPKDATNYTKKFMPYTLTGIFTTAIFWGTEISFDAFFESENSKYIGAVLGLSIGYIIKYFLDKKYISDGKFYEPS